MRLLGAVLLAPAVAGAEPTYEPEGIADERTTADGKCLFVNGGRDLVFRFSGGGAVTFDVRVEEGRRPKKHRVKIVVDGRTEKLDIKSGSGRRTVDFDDGVHVVVVEMPRSARDGGCVAILGASRAGASPYAAAAPAPLPEAPPASEPPPPAPAPLPPPPAPPAPAAKDALAKMSQPEPEPKFEAARAAAANEPAPAPAAGAADETGRLLVGAAAIAGASDERETAATRFGGFGLTAGWHFSPDIAAVGSLRRATSDQPYLLAGGEAAFAEHRTDLAAVADFRIKHRLWEILSPHAFIGPRYLALRSSVWQPWMMGVTVGARLEALLHDSLVADGEIGWAHALAGKKDAASEMGSFKTTYAYGAGLSLRFSPHFRLRFGYRGETWVLDRTNRVMHGADVGLTIRML